jgi:hypothetical protein
LTGRPISGYPPKSGVAHDPSLTPSALREGFSTSFGTRPWWADASDNNTVDIAGLPPGQHKVKIELVDANHNVFPGQVVTLTFTVP